MLSVVTGDASLWRRDDKDAADADDVMVCVALRGSELSRRSVDFTDADRRLSDAFFMCDRERDYKHASSASPSLLLSRSISSSTNFMATQVSNRTSGPQ